MLEKIKSLFILKKIFSCLDEKIKFELVQYNKSLQNKLNLSIFDYKIFSGKYIIYIEKREAKEYSSYSNELIFQGEYNNKKRNGKGKEYYDDYTLKFAGEYLNGKRHGKCKEYNSKGEVIFEGEYLNGIIWEGDYLSDSGKKFKIIKENKFLVNNDEKNKGEKLLNKSRNIINKLNDGKYEIKEYDEDGDLIFEGEYLYEKRNGKAKEYNKNNSLLFEGIYINGKRNGFGKEYYGYYKHDNKIKFEGFYSHGKRSGKGKEYNDKGDLIFEGEYLYNDRKRGKLYIKGKIEFEGDFLFNRKYDGNGYDEKGNIVYQLKNGNGSIKEYNDYGKLIFKGEYLEGKRNGKGKEYNDDEILIFEGEYLNGRKNGLGKEYNINDNEIIIFEGEYLDGRKNGNGKEYSTKDKAFIIKNLNNNFNIEDDFFKENETELFIHEIWIGSGRRRRKNLINNKKDINITDEINSKKKGNKNNLRLIFEGEYLNNKRLKGKIKKYNNEGLIIFEGDYMNGLIHGKEYNIYGKILFEGEYTNGKDNKKIGKAYNFGKLEFDGEYLNDIKWNGKGYDKNNNIIYELKDGNGFVKLFSQFGQLIYEGECLNGEKNGKGKEYHDSLGNVIFEGEFSKGKRWKGKEKQYDNEGKLILEVTYLDGKII